MEFEPHEPNPPHGAKSDFRKITFTLPQDAYEQLVSEVARRKISREPNHQLSSLIREALANYLEAGISPPKGRG